MDDAGGPGVDTVCHLLDDLADRLRRLPESRLNRVAAAARDLAQALADAATGIAARDAASPPAGRVVPTLNVFAVADQVTVTAHDLRAAANGVAHGVEVWWLGARAPLAGVLAALTGQAERVRAEV